MKVCLGICSTQPKIQFIPRNVAPEFAFGGGVQAREQPLAAIVDAMVADAALEDVLLVAVARRSLL